uniref:Uncharacterized protein n=1 Tax=Panagrolaimus sp. ES5 TaxID=591445 RepID=A0AC34F7Q0_9BILA
MDENAWDLVEGGNASDSGAEHHHHQNRRSRSSSNLSKVGGGNDAAGAIFGYDGKEIDAEALSMIIDQERKERNRRSKSPAVESLRKVSRVILEKVRIKPKKKEDWILFVKAQDLGDVALDEWCQRPKEWIYQSPKTASTLFPKILSSALLKDRKKEKAADIKCQAYIAKILRKQKRANFVGEDKIFIDKHRRKIKVNLAIISIAFLFLFTAFNALQNLQTSINGDMGADSLFALYLSLSISSLFVPSFVLNRLGSKLTLVTAFSIYIVYMIANFLPKYYSLLPVSILTGIAGSCLWAAKCVYITESGIKYAKLNVEHNNVVIVRFFGYFFMVVHLGQVAGNLISSFVLTDIFGIPHVHSDIVDTTCGHGFIDNISMLSEQAVINLQRPPNEAFLSIVTINLCCSLIALLIVVLFLNALKRDEASKTKAPHFTLDVLKLTWKNLRRPKPLLLVPLTLTWKNLRRPKPLLLVPLTVFNGIEQAFAAGLYTKAYVGCGLGISHIGYVMTAFGVADAICSLVFGPLIKLFGRMPLFIFGAVINILMIMTLMIWPLNPSDNALFYVIAGVWGMADGVWNTQINGFWVALVGRSSLEVAFANYRFWISLGLAIGFALIRFVTIDMYLLISFVFLLVGILGYLIIELYELLAAYFKHLFEACFFICGMTPPNKKDEEAEKLEEVSESVSDEDDEETDKSDDEEMTTDIKQNK